MNFLPSTLRANNLQLSSTFPFVPRLRAFSTSASLLHPQRFLRSFRHRAAKNTATGASNFGKRCPPRCPCCTVPSRSYSAPRTSPAKPKDEVIAVPLPGVVLFLLTLGGLTWYFTSEQKRLAGEKKVAEATATTSIGKPQIGGPFNLVNTEGKIVTNEDFLGNYLLVYFGFTHCPDICPEELEKMSEVLDLLRANPAIGKIITPLFITCDPQRDGIEEVKEYVKDFHPDLIGLTGDSKEISRVAKTYRIYISAPPNVAPGEDYLVDHGIFFYLMDPQGDFVDAYSQDWTSGQVTRSIENHIKEYRAKGGLEGREDVLKHRAELKAVFKKASPSKKVEGSE